MEADKDPYAEEVMNVEVQFPENAVRKYEKLTEVDYIINEIQNKLCM